MARPSDLRLSVEDEPAEADVEVYGTKLWPREVHVSPMGCMPPSKSRNALATAYRLPTER